MSNVTLSGIADEAGKTIDKQIQAHAALGWQAIELRLVNGQNICGALAQQDFEIAAARIEESGLSVTGFASAIGNWSREIAGDFQIDIDELRLAAPRMRRLGVRHIRTMSWLQGETSAAEWRQETLRRYRELTRIAREEDVILAHENCTGWAGQSGDCMVELVEEVASPNLTLLFDIGNTISHGYEPWPFYQAVRPHIGYVHVKDCAWAPDRGRSQDYRYPGEGDAQVREILSDLVTTGYGGTIAIEPHVAAIVHHGTAAVDESVMAESYLRYARQFEAMWSEVNKLNGTLA